MILEMSLHSCKLDVTKYLNTFIRRMKKHLNKIYIHKGWQQG